LISLNTGIKSIPRESKNFLLLLLAADFLFLGLHIMHRVPIFKGIFPYFGNTSFSLFLDLGLPEAYQYVKEFWIILLFILITIKTFKLVYLIWGSLFFYLFLDDLLKIREDLGGYLSRALVYPTGLGVRTRDMAEFSVSAVVGLIFLMLILTAYFASDRQVRNNFVPLLALTTGLFLFGAVLDLMDIAVNGVILQQILGILEEFGEMLVMSLICWFTFIMNSNNSLNLVKE
jgi:hypothetical protein